MPRQSTANPNSGSLNRAPPSSSGGAPRSRRSTGTARPVGQSVGGKNGSTAGILRFYTDDAPGLKVGPTTVLVLSLLFVGFVVLLHIWGKFRGN